MGNEPGEGCLALEGTQASQTNNYMSLFELDVEGDDAIERLYFPRTVITFRNCTYNSCPEQTSSFVAMSRSSSDAARVEAKLRMKGSAYLEGYCDWDAGQ